MSVHKVTHTDTSNNGKDRVYFDGKNSWKDAYYVKQGLYLPKIGSTIEAETHQWTPQGKQHGSWFLDSYKEITAAPAPTPGPRRDTAGLPTVDDPAQALKGWDIQSGDLSRYASNIVASAITAGLIKTPSQIVGWAAAAYTSGNSLREGLFPRKLPTQLAEMPDPNEDQDRDPDDPGIDSDDDIPY